MNVIRLYFYILIVIFSIALITSCVQSESCRENKVVTLNAVFLNSGSASSLSIDSLTVSGLGQDSLLYNVKKDINKINLPLNKTVEQSTFVMKFNTEQDTLSILYTNQEYFISYECGAIITHKIDTVITTNHFISSIKILNHDINTTDVQHLQIFH